MDNRQLEELGQHLSSTEYVRERLHPEAGDPTYLHLSDLRVGIDTIRTDTAITVLDYGCGGSPYRALFPMADYRRADYAGGGDRLDYVLSTDGLVNEEDETFDLILSTQVLEHVPDTRLYLKECFRLLKHDGHLYITTHGTYPDHGCPHDYYRWTAEGLAKDIRATGFDVIRIEKHTTGPRAAIFHCDCQIGNLRARRSTPFGIALLLFTRTYVRFRPWIHKMCDAHFPDTRVVTERLDEHPLYIVAACLAKRAR